MTVPFEKHGPQFLGVPHIFYWEKGAVSSREAISDLAASCHQNEGLGRRRNVAAARVPRGAIVGLLGYLVVFKGYFLPAHLPDLKLQNI